MAPRRQVGTCTSAAQHGGALRPGVGEVFSDLLELGGADQGADFGIPAEPRGQLEGADRSDEHRLELVSDGIGHVDAFDVHAQLAGVVEAGPRQPVRGCLDVGVRQDDGGVLAARLCGDRLQLGAGGRRKGAAGFGRSGEADHVGLVDQLRSDPGSGAGHHLPSLGRNPGGPQQGNPGQRAEHRLRGRLVHHRVAGQQRGQPVADGHRQRIVPRGDQAHHTFRHPTHAHLGHHWQQRKGTSSSQQRRPPDRVVARSQREVHDFGVGVHACLAGIQADQVEQGGLVVQEQVVESQQPDGPVCDRQLRPVGLVVAGGLDGIDDIGIIRQRDARQRRTRQR